MLLLIAIVSIVFVACLYPAVYCCLCAAIDKMKRPCCLLLLFIHHLFFDVVLWVTFISLYLCPFTRTYYLENMTGIFLWSLEFQFFDWNSIEKIDIEGNARKGLFLQYRYPLKRRLLDWRIIVNKGIGIYEVI